MIKNIILIVATVGVAFLIPLFLAHDVPIEVNIPQLNEQELAAQKEAAEQAESKPNVKPASAGCILAKRMKIVLL